MEFSIRPREVSFAKDAPPCHRCFRRRLTGALYVRKEDDGVPSEFAKAPRALYRRERVDIVWRGRMDSSDKPAFHTKSLGGSENMKMEVSRGCWM
jgi:hypothetical protein